MNKDYDVESKANMNKQMKQLLEESEPETIIAIHNHPGSSVPSLADLITCVKRGYNFGLVACHDGKVYKYWVDKNKFNSVNAGFALDRMETQGYDKEVRTWLEQAGVYLEECIWRCGSMDEVYKRICDKLGCEPKDIAIPEFNTEDDSWESPFKVLTNEEMNYIVNHGCLPGIEPIQK